MKAQAYPLTWPVGWPRTANPTGSQFKTTLAQAMKNVEEELARFGKDSGKKVESFLISSNFTLGQQNPKDSGVAIYFTWNGIPTCIAVDRYARIEENLQAIFRVIEAERTKLRHGGLNLVTAAFRGYAALPPPSGGGGGGTGRHWSSVLDVKATATLDEIATARNRMAQKYHPDKAGGSADKMAEINAAYEQAKKEKTYG